MTTSPDHKKVPGWNYTPDVPMQVSPFFSWPPNPRRMFDWIAVRWLKLAENTIVMAIAVICWLWFQPTLEETRTLAFGWIFEIWLRNMFLMILIAGSLHWFFYRRKYQEKRLKYERRDLQYKGSQYSFGGQLRDNMFWTLGTGVGFWTAYEVLMFWAMGNGYAPVMNAAEHPILFVAIFLLSPVWISFHFYWIHRAIHCGVLYRWVHALHHRNINVGPWSGLSMHPVEQLVYFSSILIHFVLMAHPLHILFHMQHQALVAISSHTGFESLLVKDKKILNLGAFHHQMHHKYFEVNYGNLEMPWDKWFGTHHDGTAEAHERLAPRRALAAKLNAR